MIENIINHLKHKKIAILGFGLEGKSTYKFIRKHLQNIELTIIDEKKDEKTENEIIKNDNLVKFVHGKNYIEGLEQYDIIIKTPGISFKDINTEKFIHKVTSQLELFLEHKEGITIGITGTKGKSTTSTLMYKVLEEQGKDAYLLGNIGTPIFDRIEEINKESIVVIELSSHALQYVKKSTDIAILLNIYEEHLDYYKDLQEYINSKLNIFKSQEKNGIAIFNADNDNIKYKFKDEDYGITLQNNKKTSNTVHIRENFICVNDEKLFDLNETMNLKGMHNINNIMFVFAVCKILKLDMNKAINTIKNFKPLEHRLEYVGTIDGITYYNDSIATIPEATICSIKALGNVNTLIVGGKDRGVNLQNLINYLKESNIKNIICMPTTGEQIAEQLKNTNKNIIKVLTMPEAVEKAKKYTEKNTICLLSPAAASYGFFKNFIERGNIFKENVLK